MRKFKQVAGFIAPYKGIVIIALICAVLGSLMNVLIPRQIGQMADIITAGINTTIDLGAIKKIAIISVLLVVIGFILNYLMGFWLSGFSQSLLRDMRMKLSDKLDRLSISYIDGMSTGDILSRTTNDVTVFSKAYSTNLGTIASNLVLFTGCVVMMLVTSPILTLVVIASTIAGSIVSGLLAKVSRPYFKTSSSQLGRINAYIDEVLSGHLIVRAFNCEAEARKEFEKLNGELAVSDWKSQFFSSFMHPVMTFTGNLAYVAVCIVGAYLMMQGKGITIGTIAAFILYVKQFSSPIASLAQSVSNLQPAFAVQERIFELLEADEIRNIDSIGLTDVKGEVVFDNVRFGYLPGQTIIHGFSAKVEPGMKVAIVGPTGAGKSTLVNLLMKFYEPDSGYIMLDGRPIEEISDEDLHSVMGMVLQETWVFDGTIRDNIVYSTPDVSDERFNEVLKETGLDNLVETYPDGADTEISEKMELSAGQVQLITIARAMIKDPAVLILDEATSSVDTRTEMIIQGAIDKLTAGRTSFVIAHRLSTIRNADIIFVMKDGDIVETGNHNELLQKGGLYSELYYSQFADKES
ncbi:MAG: ABC transporter ATP-binding protein/permease [Lachnospiraceae bacterium]|nr:ABC transporter ATP-binding protein/permease [Lachnospiraceae bacterium]